MPACPRDNQYSSLPPPGFNDNNSALKRVKLIESLEQIIDKCKCEPEFIDQQSKQTDLLLSIAQLTLVTNVDSKREFLNNILTIGQDLLTDENQTTTIASLSTNDPDGDFSLNDLANEYLQNEPTPASSNDKSTTPSEPDFSLDDLANEYLQNEPTPVSSNDKSTTSSEPDITLDDLSKTDLSSTPPTSILTNLVFPPPSNEPILIKPPLESILYSNRLSSNDAADEADCIWKQELSPFGQIFCTKINDNQTLPTKRISTCLLDRSLYERLTHLVILLPKQCIRSNIQQPSFRHNGQQQHRPPRPNNDPRRPSNRPSFQQNSLQRFPNQQNPRQYAYQNYPNQQGYQGAYYVDRRQQQPNRYPPPSSFGQYNTDYQYQQKGPPKDNYYNGEYQQKGPQKDNSYASGNQQQKKKSPNNNQQTSNQNRGNKKGSGGGGGGGGKYFPLKRNLISLILINR